MIFYHFEKFPERKMVYLEVLTFFLGIFIKILDFEEIKTKKSLRTQEVYDNLHFYSFGSNPHANSALISSVFKVLGH